MEVSSVYEIQDLSGSYQIYTCIVRFLLTETFSELNLCLSKLVPWQYAKYKHIPPPVFTKTSRSLALYPSISTQWVNRVGGWQGWGRIVRICCLGTSAFSLFSPQFSFRHTQKSRFDCYWTNLCLSPVSSRLLLMDWSLLHHSSHRHTQTKGISVSTVITQWKVGKWEEKLSCFIIRF